MKIEGYYEVIVDKQSNKAIKLEVKPKWEVLVLNDWYMAIIVKNLSKK